MRTWIFTSSFCKAKMLEQQLEHIHTPEQGLNASIHHVIIDQHYPIDKANNRKRIQELCVKFGCIYVDSGKDRGLHNGLNNAMKVVGVREDDFYTGCDPDDRPQAGWIQAMKDVMAADPKFAIVALNFPIIEMKKREGVPFLEQTIGGRRVWVHPSIEMFNIVAVNTSFLLSIGGFWQPFKYYGCIESALYEQWKHRGMKLGYLADFTAEASPLDRSDPSLLDPELRMYKDAHLGGFSRSFEEWLNETGRGNLISPA